jgi:hypothetical protein
MSLADVPYHGTVPGAAAFIDEYKHNQSGGRILKAGCRRLGTGGARIRPCRDELARKAASGMPESSRHVSSHFVIRAKRSRPAAFAARQVRRA